MQIDKILVSIPLDLSFVTIELEEKPVIEIDVTTGTNRPYYLREKGLKPSGVYVRKGSFTQPMTEEGIREMILQNSGISFEQCRSMNQMSASCF